jgi:hypothetical protein
MYLLNVVFYCLFFVTCVITASIFIIYALFLFYQCKLCCAAFFYSCILSVIFVLSLMFVWCFNFGLFHIQLPVDRWWICETYIYICIRTFLNKFFLTQQRENSSQWTWSACKLLCGQENCSTHTQSNPIVPPLFVQHSVWWYFEKGSKFKYLIVNRPLSVLNEGSAVSSFDSICCHPTAK